MFKKWRRLRILRKLHIVETLIDDIEKQHRSTRLVVIGEYVELITEREKLNRKLSKI